MWLYQPLPAAGQQDADHKSIAVPLGTLVLTGFAPTVTVGDAVVVDVPLATLTLTGNAPTVTASDHQTVSVPLGELVLTGFAPDVEATANVPAVVAPAVGGGGGPRLLGKRYLLFYDQEVPVETEAQAKKVVRDIKRRAIRQIHQAERSQRPLPELPKIVIRGPDWRPVAREITAAEADMDRAYRIARQQLEDDEDVEMLLL
jgi:hypothetical protein